MQVSATSAAMLGWQLSLQTLRLQMSLLAKQAEIERDGLARLMQAAL